MAHTSTSAVGEAGRRLEVGGVVEPPDDPASADVHQLADRGVVGEEGERAVRAGRNGHGLGDDTAVGDHDDPAIGPIGDDRRQGAQDAGAERVVRLGVGDDVPPVRGVHLQRRLVTVADVLAEQAALPGAEVHLAEVLDDDRLDPEAIGERPRGLAGAPQRADEDRVDRGGAEPVGEALGLFVPDVSQALVVMPVAARWCHAVDHRLRLAVTDQHHRRPAGRDGEAVLAVDGRAGVGGRGHGGPRYGMACRAGRVDTMSAMSVTACQRPPPRCSRTSSAWPTGSSTRSRSPTASPASPNAA